MTNICWSLVDLISRALESNERAAIRGDLAESGESAGQALFAVLGLVARRQTEIWKDWRPWLALVGLAGFGAYSLSHVAFRLDVSLADQFRTYWPYGEHSENGLTLVQNIICLVCSALAVISWAWTGGFVLGALSRGAIWLTGTLFYLSLIDSFWVRLMLGGDIVFHGASPLFIALHLLLPSGIVTTLVVLLAIWGAAVGLRKRAFTRRPAIVLGAFVVTLTCLAVYTAGWIEHAHQIWSEGAWRAAPWQERLWPSALLCWPVVYILSAARWHELANTRKAL